MPGSTRPVPLIDSGLLAKDLGADIVVIDTATETAHSLSGEAAEAWRSGMSRRDLLRRTGTVALAGTVVTIAMPEVMAAASVVGPVPTDAQLNPTSQTVVTGASYSFTALVVSTVSGAGVPQGTVTLTDDAAVLPSGGSTQTLDSTGATTFNLTAPATVHTPNPTTFTLAYNGSPTFDPDIDTSTVTWVTGQPAKTTPSIIFSATQRTVGLSYPLTVTVRGTAAGGVPGGTLTLAATSTNKGDGTASPATAVTLTQVPNSTTDSSATFTVKNPTSKQ